MSGRRSHVRYSTAAARLHAHIAARVGPGSPTHAWIPPRRPLRARWNPSYGSSTDSRRVSPRAPHCNCAPRQPKPKTNPDLTPTPAHPPPRKHARSRATTSTPRAARTSRPCGDAYPRSSSSAGSPAARAASSRLSSVATFYPEARGYARAGPSSCSCTAWTTPRRTPRGSCTNQTRCAAARYARYILTPAPRGPHRTPFFLFTLEEYPTDTAVRPLQLRRCLTTFVKSARRSKRRPTGSSAPTPSPSAPNPSYSAYAAETSRT